MPVAVGIMADSYNKPAAAGPPLTGLAAWYDAAATSTITATGSAVTAWNDKSGNARHLANTGTGNPTTGTRTLNGRNVIDFVAANTMDGPAYTQAQPITIVAAMVNDLSWGTLIVHVAAGNPSMSTASGQWTMYAGIQITDGAYDSNPHVWTCLFKSTTSQMWIDGVSKVTGDAYSAGWSGQTVRVCAGWDGAVAELLIYGRELPTIDRQAAETYLKAKWGTP